MPDHIAAAVTEGDLVVAAVLSGNRNFEGRINPFVRMNFLASPPLVVAYAIAGEMDVDLVTEPLAVDRNGNPVFLKEIWPTDAEIREAISAHVKPEQFRNQYAHALDGDAQWQGAAAARRPAPSPGTPRAPTSAGRPSSRTSPRSRRRCRTSPGRGCWRCSATR